MTFAAGSVERTHMSGRRRAALWVAHRPHAGMKGWRAARLRGQLHAGQTGRLSVQPGWVRCGRRSRAGFDSTCRPRTDAKPGVVRLPSAAFDVSH
ncbi:hypothetical protein WS68_11775 [Burkholderia sp. TSV86]|nr:hypothetical protein WS68_11775 [Burkholderia sp. TSV86]